MNPKHNPTARPDKVLDVLSAVLTTGSMLLTTYSLWDLFDRQPVALLLGALADAAWLAFVVMERREAVLWKPAVVPLAGWAIALAVGTLVSLHGLRDFGAAGAVGFPLLILTTKLLWLTRTVLDKDPAALSRSQKDRIHEMQRATREATALATEENTRRDQEAAARRDAEAGEMQRRLDALRHQHTLRMEELRHAEELGHRNMIAATLAGSASTAIPPLQDDVDTHFDSAVRAIGATPDRKHLAPVTSNITAACAPQWEGLSLRDAVAQADRKHPQRTAPALAGFLQEQGISASPASVRATRSALRKMTGPRSDTGTGQYL